MGRRAEAPKTPHSDEYRTREVPITAWVKCTDYQDRAIFVNLEAAVCLIPLPRTGMTKITFIGAEKDSLEVKEAPEHLIESMRVAPRGDAHKKRTRWAARLSRSASFQPPDKSERKDEPFPTLWPTHAHPVDLADFARTEDSLPSGGSTRQGRGKCQSADVCVFGRSRREASRGPARHFEAGVKSSDGSALPARNAGRAAAVP
jgi:hypothetical protein